jgi:hypothetical protein
MNKNSFPPSWATTQDIIQGKIIDGQPHLAPLCSFIEMASNSPIAVYISANFYNDSIYLTPDLTHFEPIDHPTTIKHIGRNILQFTHFDNSQKQKRLEKSIDLSKSVYTFEELVLKNSNWFSKYDSPIFSTGSDFTNPRHIPWEQIESFYAREETAHMKKFVRQIKDSQYAESLFGGGSMWDLHIAQYTIPNPYSKNDTMPHLPSAPKLLVYIGWKQQVLQFSYRENITSRLEEQWYNTIPADKAFEYFEHLLHNRLRWFTKHETLGVSKNSISS